MAAMLMAAQEPNRATPPPAAAPVIVVETSRGDFSIVTFPEEAPRTVRHVVDLVRRGFYDGHRVHRAIPGFVVQWGDPRSRDLSKEPVWGRGAAAGSGTPVGVAEVNRRRTHVRGAVGLSHAGNPTKAESQLYVTLAERPELNGYYVVFGRVTAGMDVVDRIEMGDLIVRVRVGGD
jgi:cyclophilin family peptidyl-prolyl cis-trans isomerase